MTKQSLDVVKLYHILAIELFHLLEGKTPLMEKTTNKGMVQPKHKFGLIPADYIDVGLTKV